MSVTSATRWSIMWLFVGVALAVPVDLIAGGGVAVEYVTVYLVERSLSLDNVFLFLLILSAFNVPEGLQRRLLLIGVAIAFGLRALAIVVGAELLERFSFVSYALGALLLVVALRMLRGSNKELNVEDSRSVRFIRRVLPIADEPRGGRLGVHESGRRLASPLVLPLSAITVADVTFAVDSIPAAFAITREAAVIWFANAAALLGLTSLFVLVRALVERFRFMSQTLAAVLVFIGRACSSRRSSTSHRPPRWPVCSGFWASVWPCRWRSTAGDRPTLPSGRCADRLAARVRRRNRCRRSCEPVRREGRPGGNDRHRCGVLVGE